MRRPPRPPARPPTRVLLVSAHAPARHTVRRLLELEAGLAVVGEAASGAAALALVPRVRPDVVLTDLQLPDHDGLTVALALRHAHPAVAVLLLAPFDDEALAARAARAGARGVLVKTAPARELIAAVRRAPTGQRAALPAPPAPLAPRRRAPPPAPARPAPRRLGRPAPGSLVTAGLLYWVLALGSFGLGGLQALLSMALLGLVYGLLGALYGVTGAWILQRDPRGYRWGLASAVLAAWVPLAQELARPSALLLLVTLYLGAALLLWERRAAFGARGGGAL